MSYPKLSSNTAEAQLDRYYPYRKGQDVGCIQ